MTCILLVSIMFIFFFETGISLPKKITYKSRHPRIYEYRSSIPMNDIARLQELREGVVDLLVTYSKPFFVTTIRTVRTIRANRKKWRTNKKLFSTRKVYPKRRSYPKPYERMGMFYVHFVNLFSENNDEKRRNLTHGPFKEGKLGSCYMEAYAAFVKHCHYAYYTLGGMNKMKVLLARLCLAQWMTMEKIIYIFKNTCRSRFNFRAYNITTTVQNTLGRR